jgi:broad specificity phosphatase PhoE
LAQAAAVAAEIAALKPTHLITSTQLRAIETARIVAAATDLIPESYPPFEELHHPLTLVDERLTGAHALWYMVSWFFGVKSASMHDGETYATFVDRLALARRHLEALPPNARVVIISHSVFINFFVEHMRHPKRMNLIRAALRLSYILALKNTSITHVRYEKPRLGFTGTGWYVVHGHLK